MLRKCHVCNGFPSDWIYRVLKPDARRFQLGDALQRGLAALAILLDDLLGRARP